MSIIRIGSSAECEIRFDVISPKDSVWAIICSEENNMLVLHRIVNSVQFFVNNNEVADKYWIRYGDVIIINGFRLDWQLITQLLNGYSAVQGNIVKPAPCVYGPPIPSHHEEKSICLNHRYIEKQSISSNRSSKLWTKVPWKVVSIIIAVLGAIIGVAGIILMKTSPVVYGPLLPADETSEEIIRRLRDKAVISQPNLYGPPSMLKERQEEIHQLQERVKEVADSLAVQITPSQIDE